MGRRVRYGRGRRGSVCGPVESPVDVERRAEVPDDVGRELEHRQRRASRGEVGFVEVDLSEVQDEVAEGDAAEAVFFLGRARAGVCVSYGVEG